MGLQATAQWSFLLDCFKASPIKLVEESRAAGDVSLPGLLGMGIPPGRVSCWQPGVTCFPFLTSGSSTDNGGQRTGASRVHVCGFQPRVYMQVLGEHLDVPGKA